MERECDGGRDQASRDQAHPPDGPRCDSVSRVEKIRKAAADHLPNDNRRQERQVAPPQCPTPHGTDFRWPADLNAARAVVCPE
jgi:hypothetical protein